MRHIKGRGMHTQIKIARTWDGVMQCDNCESIHPGKITIKYEGIKGEDKVVRIRRTEYCTKCEGKTLEVIEKMIRSNRRKGGKK